MPKYQGEDVSAPQAPGGESDIDQASNDVSATKPNVCPNCGSHVGEQQEAPVAAAGEYQPMNPTPFDFKDAGWQRLGKTLAARSAAAQKG